MNHRLRAAILNAILMMGAGAAALPSTAAARQAAQTYAIPAGDLAPFLAQKQFQIMAPYDALFSPQGDLVATVVCDPARSDASAVKGDAQAGAATANSAYLSMGCDVWLYDVAGGPPRALGDGKGSSWSPAWSPDGSRLVFHSDRDGDNRLWLWERDTGQVRRLSATATQQVNASDLPVWTPDGRSVIAQLPRKLDTAAEADRDAGGPPDGANRDGESTVDGGRAVGKPDGSTVKVYAAGGMAVPQQARGTAPASGWTRVDIGLFDVESGQARTLVRDVRAGMRKLSPDGRRLAYLVDTPARDTATRGLDFALVALDLESGRSTTLVERMFQDMPGAFSWSPDGRWLAYVDTLRERKKRDAGEQASLRDPDEGGDLLVVPAAGGAARRIPGAPPFNFRSYIEAPAWDASSRHIYLVGKDGALWRTHGPTGPLERLAEGGDDRFRQLVRRDGQDRIATGEGDRVAYLTYRNERDFTSGLATVDLASGKVTPLFRDAINLPVSMRMSQQSRDGRRLAFVSSSIDRPEDIWLLEGDFREPRKLSNLNPALSAMPLGKSRVIDFHSRDGKPLRASVLLPANYEPGKRYPTLFWVYASETDTASRVNDFGLVGFGQFNMQILAANGYAVVWPEIPVRVGTPVRDLLSAVSGAVERVTALGIADPRRLAVMGNSNGGYSTLALLTQTDMFRLGVMNAGFGDLTAFYGTFDGGWINWLEQQGGGMGVPPWEAPQRYLENSPIYYLDRINTPLIIQAGTADPGIIGHSDAVWVGMKRLGKDVMYLRYEGEGHALTSGANIRDFWGRVLSALDRYVRE